MSLNSKETAWAMGFLESVEEGNSLLQASAIDALAFEGIHGASIVEPPDHYDDDDDDDDDDLFL